jgi:hypothetical protein
LNNATTPALPYPRRSGILPFALAAALTVLLAACASLSPPPPVPISEVIALSRAGTPPDGVVSAMRRTIYAPRGSDFGKLAELGVQPPVLDAIQTRFVNDVELLTRQFVLGQSRGGCSACFPQLLDLANLAAGGNGMSPDLPTGRLTGGGRPRGVPEWVPATSAAAFSAAPSLTVEEIARRARAGTPAEELVRQIHSSRLDGLIAQGLVATGRLSIGTRSSVGLSGSRLAGLRQQGVADPVLDALQEQYLAQFIEFQRQRFRAGVRQ